MSYDPNFIKMYRKKGQKLMYTLKSYCLQIRNSIPGNLYLPIQKVNKCSCIFVYCSKKILLQYYL